jgi:predicted N-acetyltransferase YhbS
VRLRVMTKQDVTGGLRLNTIAGWNQTESDWNRFLECSPNGCFVMEDSGQIVGTAATLSYEERFAWIGMVLVDPACRKQGIGTKLLQRAIEYLDDAGIATVKLDATPAGKPLYEKLGFVTEYDIERWILKRSIPKAHVENDARPPAERLSEIFVLDREIFGADRSALLRSLNQQASDLTLVTRDSAHLVGYAFGRRGLFADHLGPWMARDAHVANTMLEELLRRSSRDTIIVDALKSNHVTRELLRERGFSVSRPLTRMVRGPNPFPGKPASLCAILGPEFG